jgi:adenosylmethionine-8-amino-7-oxononanoate aminotransferase
VREALELVQLPHLAGRYPKELSGGQQQRIALARAVVIEPDVLLLDEPLSALDANLREDMRVELKRIQKRIGVTSIFVTHDQSEALAMSDQIIVMSDGRVEQIGPPEEVYNTPATEFVARFLGAANILAGRGAGGGGRRVALEVAASAGCRCRAHGRRGWPGPGRGRLVVRAEKLQLMPEGHTEDGRDGAGGGRGGGLSGPVGALFPARGRAAVAGDQHDRRAPLCRGRDRRAAPAPARLRRPARRRQAMTERPESHLFYQTRARRPLLAEARGVYMWDVDGKRYLDGSSGAMVSNIGHSHPACAGGDAPADGEIHLRLPAAFRDRGLRAAGGEDRRRWRPRGWTGCSSSRAAPRRWKARSSSPGNTRWPGQGTRWKVISRHPSYHGCTLGALALTGYAPLTAPFAPMMQEMPKVPAPRAYLDGLDPDDPATGATMPTCWRPSIREEGPETVLAFIVEPVGGASTGALVPPAGYMEAVREICDRHGVLLIHDEVMCGGGRTGRFLGAEHWGVVPDILALSKGFGAGYAPLGAMVAHERIVEPGAGRGRLPARLHLCRQSAGLRRRLAVLDVIESEGLMANAARMGALLKARLTGLMDALPLHRRRARQGAAAGLRTGRRPRQRWRRCRPRLNAHRTGRTGLCARPDHLFPPHPRRHRGRSLHGLPADVGDTYRFSVLAAGRHQMPLGTLGVILGGNVRVGLEDSLTIGRGHLAESNAQQVSKVRRILEELGYEAASPAEVRDTLALKGGDRVAF